MRLNLHLDEEVAGGPALESRCPLACQADSRSSLHARRDLHRQPLRLRHSASPTAIGARLSGPAGSVTSRAGSGEVERPSAATRSPGAAAGGTLSNLSSFALSIAAFAAPGTGDRQNPFRSADRFIEGQLNPADQIFSARGAFGLSLVVPRHREAAATGPAEQIPENVADIEPIAWRERNLSSIALNAAPGGLVGPQGLRLLLVEADLGGIVAKLVVKPAFLGVREHFERSGELLELLFGGLAPGIDVGMVLAGELAVRLFELGFGGAA